MEKINIEKMVKQEVYALERILRHEESMRERKKNLDFEEIKLKREQRELMENIEFLNRVNLM
jgi:hypothetical protein